MYSLPGIEGSDDPHGVRSTQRHAGARTARNEVRTERAHGEAANSSFFDTAADRRKSHQRRCSTADESGLQD